MSTEEYNRWNNLKQDIEQRRTRNVWFKPREIWWASLGKNIGHEENGKNEYFERPVLVLKTFNEHLVFVLPLTSNEKKEGRFFKRISYHEKASTVILSQGRLISTKRMLRKVGMLPKEQFKECSDAFLRIFQ